MKNKRLIYILLPFLLLSFSFCSQSPGSRRAAGKNQAQEALLRTTKDFNSQAQLNSQDEEKIKALKTAYAQQVRSIDTIKQWTGTLTLLDLDEVESYSADTVMMRIGIDNTFDTGYQDFFSFVDWKPIPKNSAIYKKLSSLEKGSKVVFSGKPILVEHNNGSLLGYTFNAFFIRTEISEIETD
ncbi:hypothetical protein [Taibaiella chishuiensis]|uniref:Uncharacterized protein n=1 Tax=Taibaiella chishuiensis TaxID=1434707 RepID=A0A2P8D8S7_9BACT|nr:hypothetical protein [Taibaiella chishuiensis]PSK93581.1 hypothetical protein B0I18_102551 [Taibaiella chishuiensis]